MPGWVKPSFLDKKKISCTVGLVKQKKKKKKAGLEKYEI